MIVHNEAFDGTETEELERELERACKSGLGIKIIPEAWREDRRPPEEREEAPKG